MLGIHILGVLLVMKQNVASNPLDIAPLSIQTIVLESQGITDLIKKFGWAMHIDSPEKDYNTT
jgi:hypothetical protein